MKDLDVISRSVLIKSENNSDWKQELEKKIKNIEKYYNSKKLILVGSTINYRDKRFKINVETDNKFFLNKNVDYFPKILEFSVL